TGGPGKDGLHADLRDPGLEGCPVLAPPGRASRHASPPTPLRHHQSPSRARAGSLGQITYSAGADVRFSSLIFSGDGGSAGLGFVHVTDRIVEAMRRGDLGAVVEGQVRQWPPRQIFRSKVRDVVANVGREGVRAELMRARTRDPAWDFHAYFMDNDQRRHSHDLYEDLDRDRIELLLPFFDGRFQELIVSGKFEWFMYHRFYVDWLERF